MKLIQNIRTSIGYYFLNKQLKSAAGRRKRRFYNIQNAQKIGILFLVDNYENCRSVINYCKLLKNEKKSVSALGYIPKKIYPTQGEQYLPELKQIQEKGINYFSYQNVNWFNKPTRDIVNQFIQQDFDVLIDLSLSNVLPLRYIAGLSKAKFKVGRFGPDNSNYYDLMLNIDDTTSMHDYINFIKHYLKSINQ